MIKIYNNLTNELEPFKPIKENTVQMYICGPTVYNYIHIGNARPVVFFDVVARYFSYSGYTVAATSNLTDIDDKIIERAQLEGVTEKEITEKYGNAFLADCAALNVLPMTKRLYATAYITEIIAFIEQLISVGAAYEVNGTVYFDISKIDTYAELSNQSMEHLIVGARIEENFDKKSPIDFVLWKPTTTGLKWSSPWSEGRPGWHTECVAMIDANFGGPIDIHGGGMDLKFPHHDNEIAQAKAIGWKKLATYWMHNGFVETENEKMSKSLGNFSLAKDVIDAFGAKTVRFWLLSVHYSQPLTFTDKILEEAKQIVEKIEQTIEDAQVQLKLFDYSIKKEISSEIVYEQQKQFKDAMDWDFNTPNAITVVHEIIKQMNIHLRQGEKSFGVLAQYLVLYQEIDTVLGLQLYREIDVDDEAKNLFKQWNSAKQDKNYQVADELRTALLTKNIRVR